MRSVGAPFLFALAAVTYAGAVADRAFDDQLAAGESEPEPAPAGPT